jgi:hypothetical protein
MAALLRRIWVRAPIMSTMPSSTSAKAMNRRSNRVARVMLDRALEAGAPAGWVTADEVDGGDRGLGGWLETRQLLYVLAVKRIEPLTVPSGPLVPAARLVERIPPACWLRVSAGLGAKGRRWYAWSHLPLDSTGAPTGWGRWLLARRRLTTGELAYDVGAGPAGLPLVALVQVAGTRWRVEEALAGRQGAVRPGPAPGPPLALLVPVGDPGHAGVCVLGGGRGQRARPPPVGLIPLTCNEIQHLFATLVAAPVAATGHWLRWSWWRRRQQAHARACHYRQQANRSGSARSTGLEC